MACYLGRSAWKIALTCSKLLDTYANDRLLKEEITLGLMSEKSKPKTNYKGFATRIYKLEVTKKKSAVGTQPMLKINLDSLMHQENKVYCTDNI